MDQPAGKRRQHQHGCRQAVRPSPGQDAAQIHGKRPGREVARRQGEGHHEGRAFAPAVVEGVGHAQHDGRPDHGLEDAVERPRGHQQLKGRHERKRQVAGCRSQQARGHEPFGLEPVCQGTEHQLARGVKRRKHRLQQAAPRLVYAELQYDVVQGRAHVEPADVCAQVYDKAARQHLFLKAVKRLDSPVHLI